MKLTYREACKLLYVLSKEIVVENWRWKRATPKNHQGVQMIKDRNDEMKELKKKLKKECSKLKKELV